MKKLIYTLLVFLTSLSAMAQATQKLSPQDFEKKLKETKGLVLLDVRTSDEYAQGHLANATHLDFYRSDFKAQLNKLDKSKPIFVYCAVGGRSGSAASTLSALGFKQVFDLSGGIQSWAQAKKPIVK
jgi:Rhodanese-related sulfurtransferase